MNNGMMTKKRMRHLRRRDKIDNFSSLDLETKLVKHCKAVGYSIKNLRAKINYPTPMTKHEQQRKALMWQMCIDIGLVK